MWPEGVLPLLPRFTIFFFCFISGHEHCSMSLDCRLGSFFFPSFLFFNLPLTVREAVSGPSCFMVHRHRIGARTRPSATSRTTPCSRLVRSVTYPAAAWWPTHIRGTADLTGKMSNHGLRDKIMRSRAIPIGKETIPCKSGQAKRPRESRPESV